MGIRQTAAIFRTHRSVRWNEVVTVKFPQRRDGLFVPHPQRHVRTVVNQNFDVILIGSSTRSAGFSALRAGLRPLCLDQFADADLLAAAPARQVASFPQGLLAELKTLPRSPVIYTGGLENHPELLREIASLHELWGNDATVVQQARDPQLLTEVARLARVKIPESLPAETPPAPDGNWLVRPRFGSGGRGIHAWTSSTAGSSTTLRESHLFQQYIAGVPYSATFLAYPATGDVRFVGVTRQLIGLPQSHALPFQWCGNIGPASLPIQVEHLIRRFGNVLKWKAGLRGLFGVDFVLDDAGMPWIVDVNPRYPGSLEILEHATGAPLLADHVLCFAPDRVWSRPWNRAHAGEFLGKAISYAPRDLTISSPLTAEQFVSPLEFAHIADLPCPGQTIPAGHPVCTVFATGTSQDETLAKLTESLAQLDQRLQSA